MAVQFPELPAIAVEDNDMECCPERFPDTPSPVYCSSRPMPDLATFVCFQGACFSDVQGECDTRASTASIESTPRKPEPEMAGTVLAPHDMSVGMQQYMFQPESYLFGAGDSATDGMAYVGMDMHVVPLGLDSVMMWGEDLGTPSVAACMQQARRQARKKNLQHSSLREYGIDLLPCCMEQRSSRLIAELLQQDWERGQVDFVVIQTILHGAHQLALDRNGKDVLATLAMLGSELILSHLVASLRGCFLAMALHGQGCRLLQKLVELSNPALLHEIAVELQGSVLQLIESQYGNHVIQRLVENMLPQHIAFIADEAELETLMLAQHPYGCRILQLLIERCDSPSMIRIMQIATAHCADLCAHQYGNYVIQHIVAYGPETLVEAIVDTLCGNIEGYCSHKYASNVVERAATQRHCTPALIDACMRTSSTGPGLALDSLVSCCFGNFVVQRLLEVSPRHDLVARIRFLSPGLKGYGKHVQQALLRLGVR
mmetsp:Transcript_5121/g.12002  ORF Transcript_5121/g.12002 Transcript_5121/m.12002 type:complete len:487 (+) Transcript_5121:69-1529(+)